MNKVAEWKNKKILCLHICYDTESSKENKTIPNILREMADYLEERSQKKDVKNIKNPSGKGLSKKLFQEFVKEVEKGKRFHGELWYLKYDGKKWVELSQRFRKAK